MPRIVTVTLNPAIDRVYLAPKLRVSDTALLEPIAIRPGGKGINASRSLARLNIPSTAVAPVAFDQLDNFRAEFRDNCRALVGDALVPCPAPLRHTLTLLDHVDHTETHLREPGQPLPLDTLAELETQVIRLAGPDALIAFCGSLPPGVDALDMTRFVDRCAQTGSQIVVDSSGSFLQKCARLEPITLKINQHELASIAREHVRVPPDVVRAARATARSRRTLATLGPDGCVLVTPDFAIHAVTPATSGNPYCTVGCGDATLAGLLAALVAGCEPRQALATACAAGTSAALSREPGTIDPALFHSLLPQTRVNEVRL